MLPNFMFYIVNSASVTKRLVSQEHAFKKSKQYTTTFGQNVPSCDPLNNFKGLLLLTNKLPTRKNETFKVHH